MDQSRLVRPLRSAKARELGELKDLKHEKNERARLNLLLLNWPEAFPFGWQETDQWKAI